MNQILSVFLPAVLAVYVYERINKKEMSKHEVVIKYFVFVLIINILSYLISIYAFGNTGFVFTNVFTVKYLCLASALGVIISFIMAFVEKNLEVNIRVDKK